MGCRSQEQSPGRIPKMEPPILDSNTPMVWIIEPYCGSIFWLLPGVRESAAAGARNPDSDSRSPMHEPASGP